MSDARLTTLEKQHPGVRAIEGNQRDTAYLVDEGRKGIILCFGETMVGMTRDEAKDFCRELGEILEHHLGVCV